MKRIRCLLPEHEIVVVVDIVDIEVCSFIKDEVKQAVMDSGREDLFAKLDACSLTLRLAKTDAGGLNPQDEDYKQRLEEIKELGIVVEPLTLVYEDAYAFPSPSTIKPGDIHIIVEFPQTPGVLGQESSKINRLVLVYDACRHSYRNHLRPRNTHSMPCCAINT